MSQKAEGNKGEAAQIIAQYAANLKYEDLPSQIREVAKRSILDTIGVTIAGSTADVGHKELIDLIRDGGGKEESTILGFGSQVPAWMAALANGALSRALDYDDVLDEGYLHTSSTVIPSVIAIAERLGNTNGKELITAVTVGNEINCRMALSICQRPKGWKFDWLLSLVCGIFGATAAAGSLLNLDAGKIQEALGIALFAAAGSLQCCFDVGSQLRGINSGFPARSAVFSALMAEKGIKGAGDTLEGKKGLYNLYFEGEYNRDLLVTDLGERYEYAKMSFKPWPSCRVSHPYIDATIKIMRDHDIASSDIKQITLLVGDFAQTLCDPLDERREPKTPSYARFSLPYTVAVAATRGKVMIKDYVPEELKNPDTLAFAQKVVPKLDARFSTSERIAPAMVEIELQNGNSYSERIDIFYGNARNPISWQDLTDKFRECASYSAKPLSKKNIEKAIEIMNHLEDWENTNNLIRLLS